VNVVAHPPKLNCIHPDKEDGMDENNKIGSAFWALRVGLGATAFLAGADKFTNLLTDWEQYIAPEASEKLPLSNKNFMRIVGVIEMLVGIGILSPKSQVSSYAASVWLSCIAANLILNKDYDIAARDVNMALSAFALAQLDGIRAGRLQGQGGYKEHSQIAA
jgi:uncharacterized membrane protein YphA (DoxX/SURF4 family)